MTVAAVSKIGLAVHRESERAVLAALQSFGLCEIIAPREEDSDSRDQRQKSLAYGFDVDAALGDARYALRVLESYYEDSGDLLSRILEVPERNTVAQLHRVYQAFPLASVVEDLRCKERILAENHSEYSRNELFQSVLDALLSFPHELSLLTQGTEYVRGILGTLPGENVDKAEEDLRKISSYSEVYSYDYGDSKSEKLLVALYPRQDGDAVGEALIKLGFVRMDLPEGYTSFAESEKERLLQKLQVLRDQEAELLQEFRGLASEHVESLRKVVDYLGILKSRDEVSENASATESTKYYSLWCPKSEIPLLQKVLEKFQKDIDMVVNLPIEEGDAPPTILKNPPWVHPYEPLTNLYGAPGYGGIDPTIFFAPFFFLFFGMCLSDGGYGLVFACIFLWLFHAYRIEGEKRKFFSLLFWGSISTVVVGALTGSWLGDMFEQFPFLNFMVPLKESMVVLNPMNDPISFLILSLFLGVVQVLFGLTIAMVRNIREKDYIAAAGDQGGWMTLIVGLILLGLGAGGFVPPVVFLFGKLLSLLGVILLVATQGREKDGIFRKIISGILSLYNVTSFLGDILSYSRLLALGLATAAVAMIINTLTVLVSGIPYVGWIFAIVLFLGGHIFSLAVNALGAFVHSLRLQYVEFFSKFFTASGRFFQPYRFSTKYTTVTGEQE